MNTALIEAQLQSSETRQHRIAGETFFLEREAPAGVYILYSGEVDLLFAARNGNVKPLRVATPGQILGLNAVVMQRPHDCSAIARVPCDVGFIPFYEFLITLKERPAVWFNVLRLLSSDVYAVYGDMRALRRRQVPHVTATARVAARSARRHPAQRAALIGKPTKCA